jgi:pyruvate dehydrogenase E1 component
LHILWLSSSGLFVIQGIVSLETESQLISKIARRVFAYATKMIYDANHREDINFGDPKVGGHPASCSSCVHIMSALHLGVREAADTFAIKPHASPNDHSLNYMLRLMHEYPMGSKWISDEQMHQAMYHLRKFSQNGEPVFQSYHSEWDPDGYFYYPSGSVGIPPVVSMYTSLAYRYAADHGYDVPKNAHFWSLIGDSEFREGSLMEAMPDASERELSNVTWIVDYNRQNLDGTRIPNPRGLKGTDGDRMERVAVANGWKVIRVEHGSRRRAAFKKKGGKALQEAIENGFSDYAFQMILLSRDGNIVREQLLDQNKKLEPLLKTMSDAELFGVFEDLGGHDVGELIRAMRASKKEKHDPTLIIAYTIKGWGLDCYAAPGNHSALPSEAEVNRILASEGLCEDDPFARFALDTPEAKFLNERSAVLRKGTEALWELRERNAQIFVKRSEQVGEMPKTLGLNLKYLPLVHTQYVWGQLAAKLIRIGNRQEKDRAGETQKPLTEEERGWGPAAELVLTMAPDVGTSTNINPAMDERIYGVKSEPDWEAEFGLAQRGRPSLSPYDDSWTRHIRFEIAEANCMTAVGAFGKIRSRLGIPFLPIMTVYDFFIKRAFDQLYYNLYWNSGFIVIGTPSGVTLSPEGAQHSWKSDIQMANLITWEPFYAIEVDWVLSETVRRHYLNDNEGRSGVIIRAVTRAFKQSEMLDHLNTAKRFENMDEDAILEITRKDALEGGYYLLDWRGHEGYEPGENVVHVFTMGAMGSEAISAAKRLRDEGIFANVIVVTSGDLLCGTLARASGYRHLRETLGVTGDLHLTRGKSGGNILNDRTDLIIAAGRRVPMVCVVDGEAGLLDSLGSIVGVKCETLAVRKVSKSGRPVDVYAYLGIDANRVYDACGKVLTETALENIHISQSLLKEVGTGTSADDQWSEAMWPPHQ